MYICTNKHHESILDSHNIVFLRHAYNILIFLLLHVSTSHWLFCSYHVLIQGHTITTGYYSFRMSAIQIVNSMKVLLSSTHSVFDQTLCSTKK